MALRPAAHQLLSPRLPLPSAVEKLPIYAFLKGTVMPPRATSHGAARTALGSLFPEPVSAPATQLSR